MREIKCKDREDDPGPHKEGEFAFMFCLLFFGGEGYMFVMCSLPGRIV